MSQPTNGHGERRRDPRTTAAFTFCIQSPAANCAVGAWMLNVSARGAAFLAIAGDAPRVGERIELTELYSDNRAVREAAFPLPPHARVLRVDDADGATRRVAVRFEADQRAEQGASARDRFGAARYPRSAPKARSRATLFRT